MAQTATHEQLVWDRPEPVTPAGRPRADAAAITAAAFAIADDEGLHAVSIKRVAGRLKVNAIVLEAYLPGREDLLDLMLDRALAEIDLPDPGAGGDWRADLGAIARATQTVAARHPWLRTLAGTRTPSGPNGLRVNERVLAAMAGLDLPPVTRMQLANTVLAFVYGFVQLEMGHVPRAGDEQLDAAHRERTARRLVALASSGDYPNLAALFADSASPSAASAFDAGLEVVLDGIALHLGGADESARSGIQPRVAAHH